jgi:hypothetical protein
MRDLYEQGWRDSPKGLIITAPEIEAKYPPPSSLPNRLNRQDAYQGSDLKMEAFLQPWQDVLRPVPTSSKPSSLKEEVLKEMSPTVSRVYNAIQSHGSLPGHGPSSFYHSGEQIRVH